MENSSNTVRNETSEQHGAAETESAAAPQIEPIRFYASDEIRRALDGDKGEDDSSEKPVSKENVKEKPSKDKEKSSKGKEKTQEEQKAELSRQHAALSQRFQAAKRVEERAKTREAEAEAKINEAEAKVRKLADMDEMTLLTEVAKSRGLTLDQLIKRGIARIANNGKLPEADQARADLEEARREAKAAKDRVEKWENEQKEKAERAKQDSEAANYDKIIADWQEQTVNMVTEDTHPLLSGLDATEIASKALWVADQYFQKTGVAPAQEDVLDYLEQQELERFEKLAAKKNGKRSSSRVNVEDIDTESDPEPDSSARQRPPPRQARTLTNRDAAERSTRRRPMSDQELIAYAAEAVPD